LLMMAATLQPYRYRLIAFLPLAAGLSLLPKLLLEKSCHDEFSLGPARHVGSHCLLADDDAFTGAIRTGPVCAGGAIGREWRQGKAERAAESCTCSSDPAARRTCATRGSPAPCSAAPSATTASYRTADRAAATACDAADGCAVAAGDTTSTRNASRSSARAESCADGAAGYTSGSSEATGAPSRRTAISVKERAASGRDKIRTDAPCFDRAALDAACRRGAEYDASRRTRPWW
jgi:hypothetical protein